MIFEQFYLECLSQASYLIGDTTSGAAAVVDPRRDVRQYVDAAAAHGLRITHVLETHFHADFLSGHLELAAATGAEICYGSAAKPQFPARLLSDGETVSLGEVRLEVRHTPGHTPESISIVVWERPGDATPYGVLTGDTLFIGDVGRPDLLVSVGKTADELGRMLFESIATKLLTLPDATRVFPAHGAGSSCGKNLSTETSSTIGEQRATNYALQFRDAASFVAAVTEGQPEAPGYFVYDAVRNQQQRPVLDESARPAVLGAAELLAARDRGAQIVDVRDPQAFALGHLRGSVNVGLAGRYAEYAGSVIAPDEDMVLVAESGTEQEARVRLARIGYDRAIAWFPAESLVEVPAEVRRASRLSAPEFAEVRASGRDLQVVDVRGQGEFASGHLDGAVHIPVAQLRRRAGELRPDVPTVVYCAGGYRSSIGASVLRAAGFTDVSDVLGGFEAIRQVQPA
ncbi:MAG: MBL fold metallo-hydrolase [Acidobacteria bacterium]|nr:MBL fold metallo-hydrolase [Acidobacteriota bacterium]